MAFEDGGPQFGLRDGKIGGWVGDGTYTSPVDVFGIRILGHEIVTDAQDGEGDDTVLATATTILKGTVTLAFLSVQFAIIEVITGIATLAGVDYTRQMITSKNPPYIGICGKALAAEGGGDTHMFVPKCKMTGGFAVRFELKTFSIPEITFTAVVDDHFEDTEGYPLLMMMDQHEVPADIALPPVGLAVA